MRAGEREFRSTFVETRERVRCYAGLLSGETAVRGGRKHNRRVFTRVLAAFCRNVGLVATELHYSTPLHPVVYIVRLNFRSSPVRVRGTTRTDVGVVARRRPSACVSISDRGWEGMWAAEG